MILQSQNHRRTPSVLQYFPSMFWSKCNSGMLLRIGLANPFLRRSSDPQGLYKTKPHGQRVNWETLTYCKINQYPFRGCWTLFFLCALPVLKKLLNNLKTNKRLSAGQCGCIPFAWKTCSLSGRRTAPENHRRLQTVMVNMIWKHGMVSSHLVKT